MKNKYNSGLFVQSNVTGERGVVFKGFMEIWGLMAVFWFSNSNEYEMVNEEELSIIGEFNEQGKTIY